MTNQRNNLIVDIPEHTIRVAFTGHRVCQWDSELSSCNQETNTTGLSDYNSPVTCIKLDNFSERTIVYLLAHEITHMFGVVHHDSLDGQKCIMGENRWKNFDLTNISSYWCNSCINAISSNLNKY